MHDAPGSTDFVFRKTVILLIKICNLTQLRD